MPLGARARACAAAWCSTAAFIEEYAFGEAGRAGSNAFVEEMDTIAPPPARSRCGTAASMRRTSGRRSPSRPICHWSDPLLALADVFETTMSSPPSSCAAWSTNPVRAAESVTSKASVYTVTPRSRSSAATCSRVSAPRAHSATDAPSSANASAMARPIPRLPPVTSARLPFSCKSMSSSPASVQPALRSDRGRCPPPEVQDDERSGVHRVVETDEHLPDVLPAEHAQERLDGIGEVVDHGLFGDQFPAAQPPGDPALEFRAQVLVVADDEPTQGDPLEDRLDQVVDARPRLVGVELRHHPAERDPAVQPQGVERSNQVVPADVVEVQVDPVGSDPRQAVADPFGAVVDRSVQSQLLDEQCGLARPPGAAHDSRGAEQPSQLRRSRPHRTGRRGDEHDVTVP